MVIALFVCVSFLPASRFLSNWFSDHFGRRPETVNDENI